MPLFTIVDMVTMTLSLTIILVPARAVTYPSSPYSKPYQNHCYNEYHEGLPDISKTFFNALLNQLEDKTMVGAVKSE